MELREIGGLLVLHYVVTWTKQAHTFINKTAGLETNEKIKRKKLIWDNYEYPFCLFDFGFDKLAF